ncbi:LysR family transcriptional regulator [Pseudochelatococcus sp. B33]
MTRVMDMDLRLLRVFIAVVEAGGYSGAQTTLNIGSSTISLHMSDLEKRLGFRLCERGRSGFHLTDRGRTAYEETKRILTQLDDFAGSMATLRKRLAGKLLLGMVDCLTTHPDFPLVHALRRFNELDHDVHVELVVASRLELEKAVLNGHLHAAVVPYVRKINGIDCRPVLRETHHLYVGRGHPFFDRDPGEVSTEEIARQQFVLRGYQEQFDLTSFASASCAATVHSMEGMLVLLLTGAYIGFLPDHYARDWVNKGQLRMVEARDFSYTSRHMLITGRASKMASAFITFLSLIDALTLDAPRDAPAPRGKVAAKV